MHLSLMQEIRKGGLAKRVRKKGQGKQQVVFDGNFGTLNPTKESMSKRDIPMVTDTSRELNSPKNLVSNISVQKWNKQYSTLEKRSKSLKPEDLKLDEVLKIGNTPRRTRVKSAPNEPLLNENLGTERRLVNEN